MLPPTLHGPGKTIAYAQAQADAFLESGMHAYPHLDPDFILQICFEHPDRFNRMFPGFDARVHGAIRVAKTVGWVYDEVGGDGETEPDHWAWQFDAFRQQNENEYFIFTHMFRSGTWPFPPVVVAADVWRSLGGSPPFGSSYCLIEGFHRVAYLRRMLELEMVARGDQVNRPGIAGDCFC